MAGTSQEFAINKPGVYQFGNPSGYWPESVFGYEKIIQASCGSNHSVILTEAGRVFAWGDNEFGQLGLEGVASESSPTLVTSLGSAHIVRVASGNSHSMFLSKQGVVFACGWNGYGQLGLAHSMDTPIPAKVTGLPRIIELIAGSNSTTALTDDGKVWVTGWNFSGELGLGHKKLQTSFVQVPNLGPISDVACGNIHTALLSTSKVILLTGSNGEGQLGSGGEDSLSFQPLTLPSPVTSISCGGCHTVALTEGGEAWAWGWNVCGQLGTGDKDNTFTPFKVKNNITRIYCGYFQTAMFTENGDLLVCGKSTEGELGSRNASVLVPTQLQTPHDLTLSHVSFEEQRSLFSVVKKSECQPSHSPDLEVNKMEQHLVSSLECPACMKTMCAPIFLCVNGHSLCRSCRKNVNTQVCPTCTDPFSSGRNITLEKLCAGLELPCPDCGRRMSVPVLEGHGLKCPDRQYGCPVQDPCDWNGRPDTMLAHCSKAHPKQTWVNVPHMHDHRVFDGSVTKYILSAHGNLFIVLFKYNKDTRAFLVAMQYVGLPQNAHNFRLEVEFISKNKNLCVTFRRSVCSDCDALVSDNYSDAQMSDSYIVLDGTNLKNLVKDGALACQVSVVLVSTIKFNRMVKCVKSITITKEQSTNKN